MDKYFYLQTIFPLAMIIGLIMAVTSCGPESKPVQEKIEVTPAQVKSVQSKQKDTVYFLNRMVDLTSLAIPHPNESIVMHGYPSRQNIALATTTIDGKDWAVLLDEKGPGCVVRLWLGDKTKGDIRIYLDNQPEPVINATIKKFFSGNLEPFKQPLVLNQDTIATGSNICYFPIPFAKHCKVITDSPVSNLSYQAEIRKFSNEDSVVSFRKEPDPEVEKLVNRFETQFGIQPLNNLFLETQSKPNITIKPHSRQLLANFNGPAAIDFMAFQLSDYSPLKMDKINIEIYWDQFFEPSVTCTLLDLFDTRGTDSTWNLYTIGQFKDDPKTEKKEYQCIYSRYFMPFHQKAQIFVENTGETPMDIGIQYHLKTESLPDNFLYFFAQSKKRSLQMGFTYPMLDFAGQGNLVGIKLYTLANEFPEAFYYLKGAPYFYVDGEKDPSLVEYKTDTFFNMDSDVFGAGYYWCQIFGCLGKQKIQGGFSNLIRTFLLDSIPFHSSLLWIEDIGDTAKINKFALDKPAYCFYNWTCIWYGIPSTKPTAERHENVFYYTITTNPDDVPSPMHPVIQGSMLQMQLPAGTWWFHTAPVWDINRVSHQKNEVK